MSENKQKRTRQLPKGWKYYSIGDFADTSSGGTPLSTKKEYYENGDIPWINSGEVNQTRIKKAEKYITKLGLENSSAKIFPKNTVLVAMYGATAGKTSILDIEATTNQAICGIFPNEKYNSEFLKYSLDFLYEYLVGISSGSARDNLSQTGIQELKIPMPDLPTQQKIAAVLSALDAKIELNQRINAELESMAKTLYDYWFVQFAPHKSAGGKMVWNEALKREIPLGWEVVELGDYAQPIRGVTYKKDEIRKPSDKNAIPILRATNITNGVIDLNDMVYVPEDVVSEEQILNKFDVLITMSSGSKAHVGKNAFYYFDQKVSFGAFCSKLSVNENMRFYVNVQMQSDSFKKYIANVGLGTNINNLTNKHITEYKLLIPPKDLLLQYEKTVEGFYNRIGNNMKESQTLTELRDWLLPMLMNGQVTIKT